MTALGTLHTLPITDLTPYHHNPRRGNIPAIATSLKTNGQYKPIVVNRGTHTGRPMEVLAGNHTLLAHRKLTEEGTPGFDSLDTYIIDVDDAAAARIVLADNRTADLGTYDDEVLAELLGSLPDQEGTGYTDDDVAALLATPDDSTYTRDVNIPLYEPQGDTPPSVGMMMDNSRTLEFIEHINATDLPEDVAEFLRAAAARHTVLDFHRIADFYAHADAVVQQLMEEQALVIIDVDDAIRGGYARLQEEISMQRLADEGEDR